jgi:hypothetical protein
MIHKLLGNGETALRSILLSLLCASMILLVTSVSVSQSGTDRVVTEVVLDIDPVEQQTLEWCWLSVGEMIFNYLDLDEPPSGYQCGTMAMIGGRLSACWQNCRLCPYAAGSMPTLERMIRDYPRAIAAYQGDPVPYLLPYRPRMTSWTGNRSKRKSSRRVPLLWL